MVLLLRKPACLRAKNSRIHTCFCYFLLLLETLLKKNTEGKDKNTTIKHINVLKIQSIQLKRNFLNARVYAKHKINFTLPNLFNLNQYKNSLMAVISFLSRIS